MALKVLIIDDDPDFTLATEAVLEVHGCQVSSASKGAEGFEKARKEGPDLILLDVMLEDASAGLEIVRKLRDDQGTSQIPVIILTGVKRADQLLSRYAPGEKWPNVKAALEKPVDPEFLIKTVRKATE